MDKYWWFGVVVLILAFIALVAEITLGYRRPIVNMDDRNHNIGPLDELDEHRPEIPVEDRLYLCCDHCFGSAGEYAHPIEDADVHTVPCNEMVGGKPCQDEGDYC